MTTLTEFLLARLDEDEAVARAVLRDETDWDRAHREVEWVKHDEYNLLYMDPARGLAECESKRRIIGVVKPALDAGNSSLRPILYALAAPYADHPDFDEMWRP